MKPPLVSVIVPTYNRPEKLARALDSIEKQTYGNLEVIVVNDAGKNISTVVSGFGRTKLIDHAENKGLPAARNTGVKASSGRYIAYLDDDDWYYPEHIKTCVDWIITKDKRWIYTNADATFWTGRKRLYMDADYESFIGLCRHNITPVCCVLHDRAIIEEAGWFDETLLNHEDWDLWIRFAMITPPLHIKIATCCIDRTAQTMTSDLDKMIVGRDYIRERYKKYHENIAILSA